MIYFYQFIFLLIVIFSLPVITLLIFFKKCFRDGLGERLTIYSFAVKKKFFKIKNSYWIHAASVGEIKLLKNIPNFPFPNVVITTTTISGRNLAKTNFPKAPVFLIPLDFIFLMRRFKRLIKPSQVLIMETELWPGFIFAVRDLNVVLYNGRLSLKKYPVYYFFRKSFSNILNYLNMVYARDSENFERFKKIGIAQRKLKIGGNLKYNFNIPNIDCKDKRFSIPRFPVVVCGSTHKGEEEILLNVFIKIKKELDIGIIISPRHLSRLKEVKELLNKKGIKFTCWSKKYAQIKSGEIILVDTIGELAKIYSLAAVAFVGGTLVNSGGHNIIEAVIWKIPVITGPYYHNFKDMMEVFIQKGGVKVAENAENLYNIMKKMLFSEEERKIMGENNFNLAVVKKKEIERFFQQ